MSNASVGGSEVRDSEIPSYTDLRGVYILSDPSDLGTDTNGSDILEDCEIPSENVGRWAKAAFVMSVVSLGISLVILTSIFLLSL